MVSQAIPLCQLLSAFPIECGNFRKSSELGAGFRYRKYGACTDGLDSNFCVGRKLCEVFSEATDAFVEIVTVLYKVRLISGLTPTIDAE